MGCLQGGERCTAGPAETWDIRQSGSARQMRASGIASIEDSERRGSDPLPWDIPEGRAMMESSSEGSWHALLALNMRP